MQPRLSRRRFVVDLGGASAAIIVGTLLTACGGDDDAAVTPSTPATVPPTGPEPGSGSTLSGVDGFPTWARVQLGSVSAYVVLRERTGVVVDTGVGGSADAIESSLAELGVGWDAVGHVILTHSHPDHVGSLADVLGRAATAEAHAGAEDIPAIAAPRPLAAAADGAVIAGLRIVTTPGHTPGHIAVLDPELRLLIAGDALNGDGGAVIGPNPRFTDDMDEADRSVGKLAELDFDTAVFGHGPPVEGGADAQVRQLAAS